jgi:hypothetical protein
MYFDRLSSLALEVEAANYKDNRYTLLLDAIAFMFPCFHTGFYRGWAPNVGKCDIFMEEV